MTIKRTIGKYFSVLSIIYPVPLPLPAIVIDGLLTLATLVYPYNPSCSTALAYIGTLYSPLFILISFNYMNKKLMIIHKHDIVLPHDNKYLVKKKLFFLYK